MTLAGGIQVERELEENSAARHNATLMELSRSKTP